MIWRTFALAVTALLASAVPASALTIQAEAFPNQDRIVVGGAGATDEHLRISVTGQVMTLTRVAGTNLTIGPSNPGNRCSVTIANTVITCASTNATGGLVLDLGSGNDTLEFDTTLGIFALAFEPALNFGAGNDILKIDTFYNGQSVFALGGPGLDSVDFGGRATAVNATLNPAGNSTINGESMRPNSFEQMFGSSGNDVMTAGGGGVLLGGPGNDELRGDSSLGDGGDDLLISGPGDSSLQGGLGNDVLRGEGGADYLTGDGGNDLLIGGPGTDGFNGGTGTDTVSYEDRTAAISVTLDDSPNDGEPGEAEYIEDEHIEVVRGGSGNDTMIGSAVADRFEGGGGDDRLNGRGGADTLVGEAGVDTADYAAYGAGVTVTLDGVANDAGEGDNVQTENVQGSPFADTLIGSAGPNALRGGEGDDVLQGGAGADVLAGDGGIDTASYAERSAGDPVTVTLDANADDGSTGEGDLALTENVRGGAGGDLLIGNTGPNGLDGGPGGDQLDGGLGADVLAGGDGVDMVTYFARGGAVTASLNDAADDGAAGELDRIRSDVEQLQGGTGDDSLSGDGAGNLLQGGSGNDVLDGAEGPDRLEGGDGADLLVGGGGNDSFLAGSGADTLSAFDGLAEDVDCGADADAATVDAADAVTGCEAITRPGVAPPLPAPPVNPDPDGDGALVPADCNEGDPRIKPGAVDIPNDKIDQDCSGADGVYPRITSPVSNAWLSTTRGSVLQRLRVSDIPAGGRVEIRCTVPKRAPKSACPFTRKSFTPKKGVVNALSSFKKKRLRVGTVVEVRITAPQSIGRVVRVTVRKKSVSPATTLCLQPGATTPKRCS